MLMLVRLVNPKLPLIPTIVNLYAMTDSAKIYLLRHGETMWNTERRLQGHSNSQLTQKGKQQARQNGLRLRKLISSTPRLISSPLGRCRETAEIIAGVMKFDFSQIEYEDRVKELSYGRWEGQRVSDIELNEASAFQVRRANRWDIPAPDGESYSMVADRLGDWLSEVERQTLVLVSHGCAGRILRGIYTNLPKESIYSLEEPHDAIYLLENETVSRIA